MFSLRTMNLRSLLPKLAPLASVLLMLSAVSAPSLHANEISAIESLPDVPTSVNVNLADAPTIANILKGVGLARARAIVEYREANGAFSDLEALQAVKGLGEVTLEANDAKIRFED